MARRTQYDIWEDTFNPLPNPFDEDHPMLETYGKALEHVLAANRACSEKVWTVVEGDNGNWYICQGYHLVNRIGYFITELPYDPANPEHVRRYGNNDVRY